MKTHFRDAIALATCSLALLLAGCQPGPPSKALAQQEFEKKFPEAKVYTFVVKEPTPPRTKVFIVTYATADNADIRTMEVPYERHAVTKNWVQKPEVTKLD